MEFSDNRHANVGTAFTPTVLPREVIPRRT